MSTKRFAAALLAGVSLMGSASAQDATSNPLEPLSQGDLVVWVLHVGPGRIKNPIVAAGATAQTPLTYKEQDAGTFGQEASTYGKVSSDVGKPSDTPDISVPPSGTGYHEQESGGFGDTSSNVGTTAGSYGQTASSYGQNAASYGTDASNHGQTVGSFGHSLDTIANAGNPASTPQGNALLEELKQRVAESFPELHAHYVSVSTGDLPDWLAEAQGRADYPDILIGPLPKIWWTSLQGGYGIATLRAASLRADGGSSSDEPGYALVARAPHPKQARAFVLWLTEDGSCDGCLASDVNGTPQEQAVVEVAKAAVEKLAQGQGLGQLADPAIAQFPPTLGRWMSMPERPVGDPNASGGHSEPVHVEAVAVHASPRLAVVAMRLTVSSSKAFGVAHPLVVLRSQENGSWRVLHVSLNLPAYELSQQQKELSDAGAPNEAAQKTGPKGISKASPVDGDARSPRPDLWWDNNGGASLQVVEWQVKRDDQWSDPLLMMASDDGARLQTRVTAGFASSEGLYRWRVWSVGADGEMKISPWSEFTIVR